jgi:hypothetical protein
MDVVFRAKKKSGEKIFYPTVPTTKGIILCVGGVVSKIHING